MHDTRKVTIITSDYKTKEASRSTYTYLALVYVFAGWLIMQPYLSGYGLLW